MYNFGGIISILSLKIIKESHVFPNSCPFQKSPLQKKPLFSQEKTSVVFFLDSTVRLSMFLQILPGCGSATSVASRCKIVESQWNLWFDHGWRWTSQKSMFHVISGKFVLLTTRVWIHNHYNWLNPFKSIQVPFFYQDVLRDLYGNDCDPRLPTPSNPCIPAELHSSSPSEIWEILEVEKKQKIQCMFMHFSRYPHWSGWETTDCHCHPRKGVGFFP